MSNEVKKRKEGLSPFDFFAIGFGAIVGIGWAVSINNWMANAGGPIPAGLGYLLSLVFMIPIGLAYAELTPALPVAGGGVAFAYRAFGEKMAFLSGWAAVGAFITIIPWEAIYVTDLLSLIFPQIKAGDPIYALGGADVYLASIIVGAVLSCVIFAVNWVGTTTSSTFQNIMVAILLAAGILVIICSALKMDPENWKPIYEKQEGRGQHNTMLLGIISVFAMSPFFLAGFETIPQAIEDAAGDVNTVGKTVVLAVVSACLFYAILLFTCGAAMPWREFYEMPNPAASCMLQLIYPGAMGQFLYYSTLIGALAGLFTTWNGFFMATPRLMMSQARAILIPGSWARQNRYGTPVIPTIICFVLSASGPVFGLGLIDSMTMFSAAAFVLSWFITMLSQVRLRTLEPDLERPYKVPTLAIPYLGIAICAVMFPAFMVPFSPVYISHVGVGLFCAWMGLGLILYIVAGPERKRTPQEERTATLYAAMSSGD